MSARVLRSEWRASLAIVRAGLTFRAGMHSNWVSWLFLGAAVLIGAIVMKVSGDPRRAIVGAAVPLAMLASLWWWFLVIAVIRQNHAAARLVPGMYARSKRTLAGVGLFGSCLMALLFSIGGASFNLALTTSCAIAVGTLVLMAYPMFTFVALMLCMVADKWGGVDLAALYRFMNGDTMILASVVVMMLLGDAAQNRTLRDTGRQDRNMTGFLNLDLGSAFTPLAGNANAQARIETPDAMLLQGLGPGMRITLPGIVLPIVVAGFILSLVAQGGMDVVLRFTIACVALAQQAVAAHATVGTLYARPREQALLRLAPFFPAVLNALLARTLLRRFLQRWAVTSVVALLLAWLFGAGGGELLRLSVAWCMPPLAGALLLNDYARRRPSGLGLKLVALLWTCITVLMVVAAMAEKFHLAAWLATGVAALAIALAFARLRLHAMLAAPPAFPAGRIA